MGLASRTYALRYAPAKARLLAGAAGRARRAAVKYDVSTARTLARAFSLYRRHGYGLHESVEYGLLDPAAPRTPPSLCKREMRALQSAHNPAAMEIVTEDKIVFDAFCRAAGLPVAPTVGVLTREGPGWMDGVAGPVTRARWADALAAAPDEFVVKPAHGALGRDVRAVVRDAHGLRDLVDGPVTADALAEGLAARPVHAWVVQRRLRNHPALVGLGAPDALTTARIVTVRVGDEAAVWFTAARISRGGVVDNISAGGVEAYLDPATGVITHGLVKADDGIGVTRLDAHPSGAPWDRWRVPDWDAAVDLALRAARAFAPMVVVGWDVAPTPDGPVLIEGNAWADPPYDVRRDSVPGALAGGAAR